MRVSVVIPAYDEAGNIGRLVEETLVAVPADMLGEIIVVDDCSTDRTGDEVKALIGRLDGVPVRYLRHGSRSGQSAAIRTGILAASFPVIATLDGDGQNDPHDIPRLLEKLAPPGDRTGPALVGGIRTSRQAEGAKRFASKAANAIRNAVLRDGCPDTGCGTKVFWRETFLRLPFFHGLHRYLPALFLAYGHEVAYRPVNDRPRQAGHSKYNNLGRALIGIYDLIGVRWLIRRTRVPAIVEHVPEGRLVTELSARRPRSDSADPKTRAGDLP